MASQKSRKEVKITPLLWRHFGHASSTINLAFVGKAPLNLWFTRHPYRYQSFSPCPDEGIIGRLCARPFFGEFGYKRVANDGQGVLLMKYAPEDERISWLEWLLRGLWDPMARGLSWLLYPPEPPRRAIFRQMLSSALTSSGLGPGSPPPGHMYLHILATHPTQHSLSLGIGTALMLDACREADSRGKKILLFSTDEGNVRYYERFGFETVLWVECPVEEGEMRMRVPVMVRPVGATAKKVVKEQ